MNIGVTNKLCNNVYNFTMRLNAGAVYAMAMCIRLSVCLSVTSQSYINTAKISSRKQHHTPHDSN